MHIQIAPYVECLYIISVLQVPCFISTSGSFPNWAGVRLRLTGVKIRRHLCSIEYYHALSRLMYQDEVVFPKWFQFSPFYTCSEGFRQNCKSQCVLFSISFVSSIVCRLQVERKRLLYEDALRKAVKKAHVHLLGVPAGPQIYCRLNQTITVKVNKVTRAGNSVLMFWKNPLENGSDPTLHPQRKSDAIYWHWQPDYKFFNGQSKEVSFFPPNITSSQ